MSGWEKSALTLAVFLPAAGAVVIALMPKGTDRLVRLLGILFSGAALLVGIIMLFGFDYGAHTPSGSPRSIRTTTSASTASASRCSS